MMRYSKTGVIGDSAITASSYEDNFEPSMARPTSGSGWVYEIRDTKPWIQVGHLSGVGEGALGPIQGIHRPRYREVIYQEWGRGPEGPIQGVHSPVYR